MKVGYAHLNKEIYSVTFTRSNLFTNRLNHEIIICEPKTKDSNLLTTACLYRSPNPTVNNLDNLNMLLKYISDKCTGNLIILGDFNYPQIDWVHYKTNN